MPMPPAPPAPAYVYTSQYQKFDYGPKHPLRIIRISLTDELIGLCGLSQPHVEVIPATYKELAEFHDPRYLETLMELSKNPRGGGYGVFGLGAGDNPAFTGVYEWSCLLTGGSLQACDLVSEDGHDVAFSMAGGMHHGMAARASGFCYVNDPVLVVKRLLKRGKRVVYLDLDVHHGDGVQWAFFENPEVLTISMHQHPATLFPGTGYLEETGRGKGDGYNVNIPLWPDTDDDIYRMCFDELVPPLIEAFAPDYIVTQLGADTLLADPLANLNLTTRGFGHCVRRLREIAMGRWVALGGGGYHVVNVARAWTLAWSIMLDREDEVPERLPESFSERLKLPEDERRLKDPKESIRGRFWHRAKRDAEDVIERVKKLLFPPLGARP